MLRVKTFIAPSTIAGAGLGLFAGEDIKKGALVWTHDPLADQAIPMSALREADPFVQEAVMRWGFQHRPEGAGEDVFVLPADNDRFVNHSDHPNIGPDSAHGLANDYALEDIAAGTEIFTNYYGFDVDARRKLGLD